MSNIITNFYRWLRRPNKSTLEQYLETFIIIVPLAFIIRTYFYGLYQVPTGSMETTMLVGERFFADKFSVFFWKPKYGDIISFNDPNFDYSSNRFINVFQRYVYGPSNWTKRVISVPGDHIQGKIEGPTKEEFLKQFVNIIDQLPISQELTVEMKSGLKDFAQQQGMKILYQKNPVIARSEFDTLRLQFKPVVYRNEQKLEEPYLNKYSLIGVMNGQSGKLWEYRSYDEQYSFETQPFYIMEPDNVIRAKRTMPRYGYFWKLSPQTIAYDHEHDRIADEYDITLGANEYWAMGDNRLGSYDCRMWSAGGRALNGTLIHGKIVFRILSFDSSESWLILDLIKHPIDFWRRVRWGRCLQIVR